MSTPVCEKNHLVIYQKTRRYLFLFERSCLISFPYLSSAALFPFAI